MLLQDGSYLQLCSNGILEFSKMKEGFGKKREERGEGILEKERYSK